MRIEAIVRDPPMDRLAELGRRAERLGLDGVAIPEVKRDPFVMATVLAGATSRLRIGTAVALAFPRSPTLTAYASRSVQDLSAGRFSLGLGTQVRGHIERRFGIPWTAPIPRMREYIRAVRAVWQSFDDGASPACEGEHYRVTLMTPEFSPGPSEHGPIPITVGAVNEGMLQIAGELCDGVRLHPFCTSAYLETVALPNLWAGAERAGRSLDRFEIVAGGFIATGPGVEAVRAAREDVRRQVAFYASTRGYAPVLELHGWGDLGGQLRRLIAQQRWDDLSALVPDTMLDELCTAAPYEGIADRVAARYAGLVNTLTVTLPLDEQHDDALARAIEALRAIPAATG